MSDAASDFGSSIPAWRARRLRAHLSTLAEAGRAAREAGEGRAVPQEAAHRAEVRSWLSGWDSVTVEPVASPPQATPRQLAKLERWQAGAGRLKSDKGVERSAILDAVAEEMLQAKPLAHGAIAAAHRETVRRCRQAGLPGPKASRYRKWLKLARGI